MKIAFNNYNVILGQAPNICTIYFFYIKTFSSISIEDVIRFDTIFFVVLKFTNWELYKHTLKHFFFVCFERMVYG